MQKAELGDLLDSFLLFGQSKGRILKIRYGKGYMQVLTIISWLIRITEFKKKRKNYGNF